MRACWHTISVVTVGDALGDRGGAQATAAEVSALLFASMAGRPCAVAKSERLAMHLAVRRLPASFIRNGSL
jgi:hypothetical protein